MKSRIISSLLWMLLCLFSINVVAQYRVVDSSQRRAPEWVNALKQDFLIVSAEGLTISEAQQNVLLFLKERIVTSVADHVKSESQLVTEEVNYNDNVYVFLEEYSATITTQSGDVPFLQGISLSKAEGYYWEQLRNRSTGSEKYRYHIKYPFPDAELRKLVRDFQMKQLELTEQMENLVAETGDVHTVEQILSNISELETLASYFVDTRKEQALNGIIRYRGLLNSITLYKEASSPGDLTFGLRAGDRMFTTAQPPDVRSQCARITAVSPEDRHWVIQYNTDYCYDDPENHIEVNYRIGTSSLRKKFYFDVNEEKVSISLNEPLHFTAIEYDDETIHSSKLRITLHSEYDAAFVLEEITLDFDDMSPIIIKDINRRFTESGTHNLAIDINEPLDVSITRASAHRRARVSGHLMYREEKQNKRNSYRIYRHNYTTSW